MRSSLLTRADLLHDLVSLGLVPGDSVMVHAAISRIGPMINGPNTVIAALCDAVGAGGTILAYCDWDASYEAVCDGEGRVPADWRERIDPFDPIQSRAVRDNGIFPEFLRTTPGAWRSANPGASVAALGARAEDLTADHALDYGYGEDSPYARLVAAGGKVLMLGAPLDTITVLHHAEHLAQVPGKRIKRIEVPLRDASGATYWRWCEEFETAEPVIDGLEDDYFAQIMETFLATGQGRRGLVGNAACVLVPAGAIVAAAIAYIEAFAARRAPNAAS